MKILKSKILLLAFLLMSANLFAQEEDGAGSAYSIFGIGDLNNYSSTRTYSMGILGNALFGNYVNNLNPATMTKLNSTLISINGNYGFLKSTNGIEQNKVSNGNVLGVNIGIPFDQGRGWVFSLGFNPMTAVNYKIRVNGITGGGQNYVQTYSGKGGLSRINAGMSYNLFSKVSIGVEYNYAFGEIRNQNLINFNNQGYTNTNIKRQVDFQNSFIKAGAVVEVGKLFKSISLKDLSIGFVYQSAFKLSGTENGIYLSSVNIDTTQTNQGKIDIPELYGFGISNLFARKYLVSADVVMQDWTKYSEFGQTPSNFDKSMRAGIGVEILPSPDKTSFWQTTTYRFGGFYDKLFYKINGEQINAYGVRAGINVPISRYNSMDLGFNYSIKGKTDNGLIKDEFFNITFGVNFGELWFLRPRDEDR